MPKPSPTVDEYLAQFDARVRQVADGLRTIVREAAPDARERVIVGWQGIFYSWRVIFCYLGPLEDGVRLSFNLGSQLDDPKRLLSGKARDARGIDVRSLDAFDIHALQALVVQAMALAG